MPVHNTPEALLPRSDSKNPATTCKGLTSSGRPCRRSLAASPRASPSPSPNGKGVLAVLSDATDDHDAAAAYFCWQHKDQAASLANGNGKTEVVGLEGRSSIDTLADKLGVLEVDDAKGKRKKKKHIQGNSAPVRRETLPQPWQNVPGPLMSVPEDPFKSRPAPPRPHPQSQPQRRRTKGDVHFSFFCCMRPSEVDDTPGPRLRPQHQQPMAQSQPSPRPHLAKPTSPYAPVSSPPHQLTPRPQPSSSPSHSQSQTQTLLSLIPPSLTPATTSLLLAELAKPLSQADQEPGYIYIFCLAPTSHTSKPGTSRSLALAQTPQAQGNLGVPQRMLTGRRTSDVLRSFAQDSDDGSGTVGTARGMGGSGARTGVRNTGSKKRTLMLKIGRAANVQRRMNQWSAQCGHDIDLLRYYPYVGPTGSPSPQGSPHASPSPPRSGNRRSSAASAMSQTGPRKVPFVPRVERLIHVELAERRVKRICEGCGREHREWFEIEATREGVRAVDECVRRWIGWGEKEGAGGN